MSYRTNRVSQRDFTILSGWISFSKSSVCLEEYALLYRIKDWYIYTKKMIKNLHCFFAQKLSSLLSLLIGCWEVFVCLCVCVCGVCACMCVVCLHVHVCNGDERSLNKWNQGKIIAISWYMGGALLGTPFYKQIRFR